MQPREITVKSILTRTGGFLSAYSHTINPYRGCAYGASFCGAACYAPEVRFGSLPDRWGRYLEVKINAPAVYARDHDRTRDRGEPLVVFMSSVTDPYVPQERRYRITGRLLEAMLERPPDALVLQTHTPNPLWDAETLVQLAAGTRLVVQISVETDREAIPGFPRHAYSVEARLAALGALRARGLRTVAIVAPLMPLADPEGFAARLGAVADEVVLDHYLVGDGSPEGARTRRRKAHLDDTVPNLLAAAGFEEWTRLDTFHAIVARFRRVLGTERIGVSADGFNRVVRAGRLMAR
jgi:DNA repair photolyase